jgi:toxin ParE1/3/4
VKPVIIHSLARAELDEAVTWHEARRRGLGLALQDAVEAALRIIQENPNYGSPYKRTEFRYWVVRRFKYVIFYMELEDAIWVAAIAHGRRRPDYWRRRKVE